MYQVSEELNELLAGQVIDHRIRGRLTVGDDAFDIAPSDIVPGSLTINNKAVSDSNFNLGSVYVGECSVTLMMEIDRYSLYGSKLEFWDDYTLGDGSTESVPLGVWYVDEPTRTKRLIALKCYDAMTDFDTTISDTVSGTAWNLVSAACEVCGVPFEQTEEDFAAVFVNHTVEQVIELDSMETYRDALSSIAKALGGFFTINRGGSLELRAFMPSACATVPASRRVDCTVSDYETYFAGVGCKFIAQENNVTYTAYSDDETLKGTGTFLDIGDVPSVRGLPEVKHEVLGNILVVLEGIRYVPSSFTAIASPLFELGDCLELEDINGTGESCLTIVTSIDYKFHGTASVQSVGYDSKLSNVRDKADRYYADSASEVEKAKTVVYTSTNATDLSIREESETVCDFYFAAVDDCKPLFVMTLPVECSDDGNIVVEYYIDNIENEQDRITRQVVKGRNAVTLVNSLAVESGTRCNLTVRARFESAETSARVNEAAIAQIAGYLSETASETTSDDETDTSPTFAEYAESHPLQPRTDVPVGTVAKFAVKAAVFAQGLASAMSEWDGTITVEETIGLIDASSGIEPRFDATVPTFSQMVPTPATFTQTLPRIEAACGQMLRGFTGMSGFEHVASVESWTFPNEENVGTYDRLVEITDDGYTTKTHWTFESEPENIDEGSLGVCETWCDDIDRMDESEVIE